MSDANKEPRLVKRHSNRKDETLTGMEAAIRNALDRANNPDKAARARIYHSAFEALKRNLEKKGVVDPALLQSQGGKLKDLIVRIEREYSSPAPMDATAASATPVPVPTVTTGNEEPVGAPEVKPESHAAAPEIRPVSAPTRREPEFGFPPETGLPEKQSDEMGVLPPDADARLTESPDVAAVNAPSMTGEFVQATPEIASPGLPDDGLTLRPQQKETASLSKDKKRKLRIGRGEKTFRRDRSSRHLFASGFSGLVLLSFLSIGIWWMIDTGAFQSVESRDTSVPNPPPQINSEDFEGNGSAPRPLNPDSGFTNDWVSIFAPVADQSIEAGRDTEITLVSGDTGNSLQIRSNASGESGEISIPIDAATLQLLAGRRSIIALTLRSVDAGVVQFYVKCDFGTLGGCGRHRFESRYETTDSLIEVDFTQKLAPNEGGRILINGDVSGTGHGIELFSVRARAVR